MLYSRPERLWKDFGSGKQWSKYSITGENLLGLVKKTETGIRTSFCDFDLEKITLCFKFISLSSLQYIERLKLKGVLFFPEYRSQVFK